ncbi:MAG: radical SAM protein, partial [Planctomycetes bacterium]|nr:radical SAM protein [Planctomycetota bacterium]
MPTSSPTIDHGVDLEVFRSYAGLSLPRHVSYPMPTWWKEIDPADAGAMLQESTRQTPGNDLSLYVHIPFCQTLCKFCACNRVIVGSANDDVVKRVDRYLDALEREIRSLSASIDAERPLRQIHWGGGSPTYLSGDQIERVFDVIADVFHIDEQAEIAMEIDPRGVSPEKLSVLKRLGFNRLSMGIQDFDRRTQEHVRRVQP